MRRLCLRGATPSSWRRVDGVVLGGRAASWRGAARRKARTRGARRGGGAAWSGGAARRRCREEARNGTRFVGRRVGTSRGGIGNGFGGSGGLLVRHDDWCCCFLSLGLRARVRVDSCARSSPQPVSRRRRGDSDGRPCLFLLAVSRAHSNFCSFLRWTLVARSVCLRTRIDARGAALPLMVPTSTANKRI